MSIAWNRVDFEAERRYREEQRWPRFVQFMVWVMCIFIAAGMWGLALTVGRWIGHLAKHLG